jgi:hypothetical protein
MKCRSLLLGSALLCLFAWAEPSLAQYSAQCIELCRMRIGSAGETRYNACLHKAPICTGQPLDGVAKGPARKNPAAPRPAQPTAAQRAAVHTTDADRAACGADYGKFCRDVVLGGGRGWACLATRKNELSPACKEAVVRHGL